MSGGQKKTLIRICISAVLLAAAFFIPVDGYARLIVFLVPYALIGWDILWRAAKNIVHGRVFDENFLMSLATIGAFCIGEYPEGVVVMLFYQIGSLFESVAVGRSRKSISELMDIRPDYANIYRDGQLAQVSPEEINVGDIIVVKPGEKIPLDGHVVSGTSGINTSALTGEAAPRSVAAGDGVISGCVNMSGLLELRVAKRFEESTVSKILELVENASDKKAKSESFITRFARIYTPVVVISALLLAVIPPIFVGSWADWINRALIFLVVSCPCALVISVPLSFFGGIGGASRCGILIKGSNYLEALAKTDTVVFDKTGTLTKGTFSVTEAHSDIMTGSELLSLAAIAENYSDHPIAASICAAAPPSARMYKTISDVLDVAGHGVSALADGMRVCVGNSRMMARDGIAVDDASQNGTVVHVSLDGAYAGYIVISDEIKPDSADAIAALKKSGVKNTVILTGDTRASAAHVAAQLGIADVRAELLPGDKVACVEELLRTCSGKLAFVGDGINDAPVLSRADIGIAMGALGSDAAIEAADVVLMDDKPSKLALAMKIARKTLRIVRQNIIFALGVKLLVLALSAFGFANMWAAVFADVGVSVIAITNATRALRTGK